MEGWGLRQQFERLHPTSVVAASITVAAHQDHPRTGPRPLRVLVDEELARMATSSATDDGHRTRAFDELFLDAVVSDVSAQVARAVPLHVLIGTSPALRTATTLAATEALLFLDLRERTLLELLTHALIRAVEDDETEHGRQEALGMVALQALGSLIESTSGHPDLLDVPSPLVESLANLTSRTTILLNIGMGHDRLRSRSRRARRYTTWNPVVTPIVVAHEMAHVLFGGRLTPPAIVRAALTGRRCAVAVEMAIEAESDRGMYDLLADDVLGFVADVLGPAEKTAVRHAMRTYTDGGEGHAAMQQEVFADFVAVLTAAGSLVDTDAGPHPAIGTAGWATTVVAIALNHSARVLGTSLRRLDLGPDATGRRLDVAGTLAAFIHRAVSSLVALMWSGVLRTSDDEEELVHDLMVITSALSAGTGALMALTHICAEAVASGTVLETRYQFALEGFRGAARARWPDDDRIIGEAEVRAQEARLPLHTLRTAAVQHEAAARRLWELGGMTMATRTLARIEREDGSSPAADLLRPFTDAGWPLGGCTWDLRTT